MSVPEPWGCLLEAPTPPSRFYSLGRAGPRAVRLFLRDLGSGDWTPAPPPHCQHMLPGCAPGHRAVSWEGPVSVQVDTVHQGGKGGAFSGLCLPVMYSQRWECWHIAIAISKSKFNTSPKSTYDLRDNRLRWGSIQWGLRGLAGFVDSPPSSPSSAIVPLGLTYPWSLEDVTTARSHVCKACTCFWGFASSETSRGESQASWSGTRSSLPFLPCPRCGLGHVAPPPPCLHPPPETQH